MRIHLTRAGQWEECLTGDSCELPYHSAEITLEEAQRMPAMLLSQLLEALDPPTQQDELGKTWHDEAGAQHRDFDLPAVITTSGHALWFRHGKLHRDGDKPAYISRTKQHWIQDGEFHRENDLPARIEGQPGRQTLEWYQHGQRHRDGGRPAIVNSNNSYGWYEHGKFIRFEF